MIALIVAAAAGFYSTDRPPQRYQAPSEFSVSTKDAREVNRACIEVMGGPVPRNGHWDACGWGHGKDAHLIIPNPCLFPGEKFAETLCHEQAHVNGWTEYHER